MAGDTSFWRRYYARQRRVNVDGAEVVARACVAARVRRLVHTSTIDTIGSDPSGGLVDEAWPKDKFNYEFYNYATTKREGERRGSQSRSPREGESRADETRREGG